jgi:hypothetical protein
MQAVSLSVFELNDRAVVLRHADSLGAHWATVSPAIAS